MSVATPRQARSERTLQDILAACDRLLAERPFEQISMADIAREAGVSVGNLYNRFSDKDGLVNHVSANHQQRILAMLKEALAQAPENLDLKARLDLIVEQVTAAISPLRPLFATLAARLARGEPVETRLRSNSENIIDTATDWLLTGKPELDPERCRFAVGSMIFNLQFNLMFGTPERLFGEGFSQPLSHQAYCYITEGNDNV